MPVEEGDAGPLSQPPGQEPGLVEPPFSLFCWMEGHGDERIQTRPDVLLPPQAPDDKIAQVPSEDFESSVLEDKDGLFDHAFIPGGRPMFGEKRPSLQARGAEMALSSPGEESSATKTEGRIRPLQAFQAVSTDDFFSGPNQEGPTDFTGRRKEEEGPQLPPGGEPGAERCQVDSSLFC